MGSWRKKTQVVSILAQSQTTKAIRPPGCMQILTPRIKLSTQWKKKNHPPVGKQILRGKTTQNPKSDK